jgi:hypothetical protein
MRKRFAAVGLAAGLAGGAIAGAVLTHPSISGAQTETTTPDTTTPDTTAPGTATPRPERGAWIQDALAPLVANGTINQSQADAVASALEAAKPPMDRGPGPGGPGGRGFGHGPDLDAAAKAIGISTDDLRTALQSGQSLADIAQAHGVTTQALTDALVAAKKAELDAHVASGDITQAEADQKLAALTQGVTAMVNGQFPAGGPRFHDHGPHNGDDSSPSTTSATSTSTA